MHKRHQHLSIPMEIVRTVVAISETGSLSKAGERLGLSQPAISSQIRRLQNLVGGALFFENGEWNDNHGVRQACSAPGAKNPGSQRSAIAARRSGAISIICKRGERVLDAGDGIISHPRKLNNYFGPVGGAAPETMHQNDRRFCHFNIP